MDGKASGISFTSGVDQYSLLLSKVPRSALMDKQLTDTLRLSPSSVLLDENHVRVPRLKPDLSPFVLSLCEKSILLHLIASTPNACSPPAWLLRFCASQWKTGGWKFFNFLISCKIQCFSSMSCLPFRFWLSPGSSAYTWGHGHVFAFKTLICTNLQTTVIGMLLLMACGVDLGSPLLACLFIPILSLNEELDRGNKLPFFGD